MQVLKIKFGAGGEKVDAFGMRFYGNIDQLSKKFGTVSEIFSASDEAPVTRNKRITLWFSLEHIRPYDKISDLLGMLMTILKQEKYEIVYSSLDELVDTTTAEYAGTPESNFPAPDRMHGYNASRGFSVTAEKNDPAARFSAMEIETIKNLAENFGRIVYGRSLLKTETI